MSWTTGYRVVAVHHGPTLSQTLASELAASKTQRPYRQPRMSDYQRLAETIRGEILRNQIRSLEAADPRNRHERRKRTAMIRDLQSALSGRDSYN